MEESEEKLPFWDEAPVPSTKTARTTVFVRPLDFLPKKAIQKTTLIY
jgi:hypothetical protein